MSLNVIFETSSGASSFKSTFEVPLAAIGAGTADPATNQAAISQFMLDAATKVATSGVLTLSSTTTSNGLGVKRKRETTAGGAEDESQVVSKTGIPKVQLHVSRIGDPLKIITPVNATAGSLKKLIGSQLGEDPDTLLLDCGGQKVYDSHTLTDLIQSKFTIHLSKALTIFVRTVKGVQIKLNVTSSDTIAKLKEKVEEKQGIPPMNQRLIFWGKQLCESLAIDEVRSGNTKIEEGSVLHLVEALRGC